MTRGRQLASQLENLEAHLAEVESSIRHTKDLAAKHPDQCLVSARKTLEVIVKYLCSDTVPDYQSEWPLDQCISKLSRLGTVPRVVEANMRNIQKFGNIGAHKTDSSQLTSDIVQPCLDSLEFVRKWYFSDYHDVPKIKELKRREQVEFSRIAVGVSIALLGAFFWALGSVITRYGVGIDESAVLEIAVFKYFTGAVFVCIVALLIADANKEKLRLGKLLRSMNLLRFFVAAAFKAINTYCFVASVTFVSAKLAAALENLHLVWCGLIVFIAGRRSLSMPFIVGAGLVSLACILLLPEQISLLYHQNEIRGVVLALVSGIAFTGFVLVWPSNVSEMNFSTSSLAMGILMLLATCLLIPAHFIFSPFVLESGGHLTWNLSTSNLFYQLINGIVGIGVTYFLICEAIRQMGHQSLYTALILSMCLATAVPFTLLLEYMSFGEAVTLNNMVGLALFMIGFVMVRMHLTLRSIGSH